MKQGHKRSKPDFDLTYAYDQWPAVTVHVPCIRLSCLCHHSHFDSESLSTGWLLTSKLCFSRCRRGPLLFWEQLTEARYKIAYIMW